MIDGHVHVWTLNPARYPWRQTLAHVPIPTVAGEAETLIAEMEATGVSHAVLVQPSVYGWDNSYLCDVLERWPSRFAGVCLVDPNGEDAPERLAYWTERGCRGVRINLIALDDVSWMMDARRQALWSAARDLGISISMQMQPAHAPVIAKLAGQWPQTTFVVDYMGGAAFHDGSGLKALEVLGPVPNVWFKIQALGTDSRQTFPFADLWPLYEDAYRRFGSARLVFGTDFPHIYKTSTYAEGIDWFARLPFLDGAARQAIGHDNAAALWSLTA